MPAFDRFHQAVKNALAKDGWTITHDPLHLRFEEQDRQTVERVLCEVAQFYGTSGDVRTVTVFDEKNDHYLLVREGWDGSKRVHYAWVHVALQDGKFWIQQDGTQDGVAVDLMNAGVPKERIVLAFQHPSRRKYGEFAPA